MGSSPLHIFHLHSLPPSLRHHQCHRCCSVGSYPVRVLVPSLPSRHSYRRPVQSLWRCWVSSLMLIILRMRLRGVASSLALCPVQFSFGILTRDDKRRWPSSVCLSPGSLAACLSTASASARLILSSAAASRADPDRSPFSRPSILLRHASLSLLVFLASSQIPTPGTTLAEIPPLEVCPANAGPRHLVFHQHLSWVSGVPSPRVAPFRLECRMHGHCHPGTTERLIFQAFCPRPISPTRGFF